MTTIDDPLSPSIEDRVDARMALHFALAPTPSTPAPAPRRDSSAALLAVGTMAVGIPVTAICAGAFPAFVGLLVALGFWLSVAAVNVSYQRGRN